ncbi:MAG: hypothetical protein WCP07_12390 [bacterium]
MRGTIHGLNELFETNYRCVLIALIAAWGKVEIGDDREPLLLTRSSPGGIMNHAVACTLFYGRYPSG